MRHDFSLYYKKNSDVTSGIRTRALWVPAEYATPMTTEADAKDNT